MRKGKEKAKKESTRKSRRDTGSSRFSFHNAKMATKLCIISGVVLFVCMMATDLFSMARITQAMHDAQDELFYQYSDEAILKLQTVFEECEAIVGSVTNEMEYLYGSQEAGRDNGEKTEVSTVVPGAPLTMMEKEAEIVMLNTIWAGMKINPNLEGVGVFLEADQFAGIHDYAPYGIRQNINNGSYQTFTYDYVNSKDYYTQAKGGTMSFMDAYIDVNGTLMYSAGYPIMYNGQFKGIVLMDIVADIFSALDEPLEKYPSMYVDLIRNQTNVLYSTKEDTITKGLSELMSASSYNQLQTGMAKGERFWVETKESDGKYVRYVSPVQVGGETWWLMVSMPEKEYGATITSIERTSNVFSIATVLIVIVLITVILKRMLKPLSEIEGAATAMANGSLHVNVTYESGDEIGDVAHSMRVMTQRTNAVLDDMGSILNELSNENFRVEMTNKDLYVGDYAPMVPAVESIVSKLSNALINIKIAAEQVGRGAEQVAAAAQDLSQGSTEQAATVQDLSRSMEQISDETKHTAQMAEQANKISGLMGDEVVRSNQKMQEMSEAMKDITSKSNEIEKIIKTIDDIAFQTNILALNAAVEAARAGSAGKGFAVVADEVRNLAQKSAEAAKNTTALIEGTIQSVANGGRLTEETAGALQEVAANVEQVAKLIHEISVASAEQSEGIIRTTNGIEQISAVIQTNSATAEECAATSEELSSQVSIMNGLVSRFKLKEN